MLATEGTGAALNLQDFDTSRWSSPIEVYTSFGAPERAGDFRCWHPSDMPTGTENVRSSDAGSEIIGTRSN
jgi:hypothetical protein